MGRGRAPCCDKSKVKKGPWSPAEDLRLISFIQKHGHDNWRALPKQSGLLRCGKSCRLRWINYLRPDVKRGNFSPEEEETIISLHRSMGNKWSKIASHLPGRTDNEIKNVWNTHLKKKLGTSRDDVNSDQLNESKEHSLTSYSASPSSSPSASSCISYGDLNLDKGPAGQESVSLRRMNDLKQDGFPTVTLEQCKPIDQEPKEASISPTHSNNTGNVEEKSSPFHGSGPSDQVQNPMTESARENIIEIPSESDIDFWNIFDALDDPTQSPSQEEHDIISHSSNFEDELEYKKWLRYLENELGLVGGTDTDDRPQKAADQQLVIKTSENEMIFRPEIDPAMAYFSMWPSSPQNFGI